MALSSRVSIALKALRQLGLTQVGLFGLYKVDLVTGYYRFLTVYRGAKSGNGSLYTVRDLFSFPTREQVLETIGDDGKKALLAEADEIVNGKFRMFGGEPVDISLAFDQPLRHWTNYETGKAPIPDSKLPIHDIKFIWEPARFGWAFALGRAYRITGDDKYTEAFWRYFEIFTEANPPYLGPNWTSGQEVAIRLMTFVWANQIFSETPSSTDERKTAIAQAIAYHAVRIPPTLIYSRSQNNNHLLTEAAGLYTASLALPEHPKAKRWRRIGQKWLNWCFENQIDETGEYIQHSTNYQRLMLQTALWIGVLIDETQNETKKDVFQAFGPAWLSDKSRQNLGKATRWLADLTDPISGQAVNLGANDGALIFLFSTLPFENYHPVVQAAGRAFLRNDLLPPGAWDEMSLWFGLDMCEPILVPDPNLALVKPRLPILRQGQVWGYLRAATINSRPSHADSLHFDLWWHGLNIARDAGTYLYNDDPPWDNRLTSTLVHNTVSVDGREQMTRAGRFLYLDWQLANADWGAGTDLSGEMELTAAHNAYGVDYRRSIIATETKWVIEEFLNMWQADEGQNHMYRLHWLLPDWEWELESREQNTEISLISPFGKITLNVLAHLPLTLHNSVLTLVRAGEYLHGSGDPDPIRGWFSPTYGVKLPALSLALEVESTLPITFTTEFIFPTEN